MEQKKKDIIRMIANIKGLPLVIIVFTNLQGTILGSNWLGLAGLILAILIAIYVIKKLNDIQREIESL